MNRDVRRDNTLRWIPALAVFGSLISVASLYDVFTCASDQKKREEKCAAARNELQEKDSSRRSDGHCCEQLEERGNRANAIFPTHIDRLTHALIECGTDL